MTKSTTIAAVTLLSLTAVSPLLAHDGENGLGPRVDDHAPIGVMADHVHKKGEWMYGARAMSMTMGDPDSLMMGPQSMRSGMGMIGLMAAPADWVTFSIGANYSGRKMTSIMMGDSMEMQAEGLGDINVNALFPVINDGRNRLIVRTGLTLPTGETSVTNAAGMRLNQMMQPANRSWRGTLSATYVHFGQNWSLGAQLSSTFNLADNKFKTQAGTQWHGTSWLSYTVADQISLSTRIAYESFTPHADNMAGERKRTRALFGINTILRGSFLKGQRIALEFGTTLDEDKGGHALSSGNSIMLGLQRSF